MHLAYLLKSCITVSCFQFLLGVKVVPREIKDKGYANFFFWQGGWGGGGVNKVHYGLCGSGELY